MLEYQKFWKQLCSGHFASMVRESSRGQTLSNAQMVYNVLKPLMADENDVEKMYGVFLDVKNKIISLEILSIGTATSAHIYPREIVKRMIQLKSVALVVAHNHPSDDPEPSFDDKAITVRIGIALKCIGASLHDHIIIGGGGRYCSMSESGLIARLEPDFNRLIQLISN